MIPALIVPLLTRPDLLYRMLDSIDHPVMQVVVIDNGDCVDRDRIADNEHILNLYVLSLPANLGVAGSWNLGIKCTPFEPWWLIVNFDVVWPEGSLERFAKVAGKDSLTLSGGLPEWCAFAIGEQVVRDVGLFDEAFHPGYFEDNDYVRRCEAVGTHVNHTSIPVRHDNSSTIVAGYAGRNGSTFGANASYFGDKVAQGDLSEGRWTLDRRREQTWD